ncbi:MAG: HEAT repeat domain-containing protein, partial [Hyphomicrobium sp.]
MSDIFEDIGDLDELAREATSPDAGCRRVAALALGDSGLPGSVPLLGALINDADGDVRQQAAEALGQFDGPDVAAFLIKAIHDPEPNVRAAAIAS